MSTIIQRIRPNLKEKILPALYWFGLALMVISIPIFNLGMSLAIFWLLGVSIIYFIVGLYFDLNVKQDLSNPWRKRYFLLPALLFLIHLIGLIYTTDFEYGLKDIRIKSPLLILPFTLCYLPSIPKKVFYKLLWIYVVAVVFSVFTSLMVYWGMVEIPYLDVREITMRYITRISHIRLSLSVVFCLGILYYLYNKSSLTLKITSIIIASFLLYFLITIQSITGIFLLIILVGVVLIIQIYKSKKNVVKMMLLGSFGIIAIGIVSYSYQSVTNYYTVKDDVNNLPTVSKSGNKYEHDLKNKLIENHHYVYINIVPNEIREGWKTRSAYDIKSKDDLGQNIYPTLIRYMTSLGLNKDLEGVKLLSEQDINNVEKGKTSFLQDSKSPLRTRMDAILFEINSYQNHGNPSGNSITQRLAFWEAGWLIFKKSPIIGIGTGDIKNAFEKTYNLIDSPLDNEHRLRTHNQYLTFAITFGIIGLIVFITLLVFPIIDLLFKKNFLLLIFIIISSLSFLTEDTLETHAGICFFSFFYVFLLKKKEKI